MLLGIFWFKFQVPSCNKVREKNIIRAKMQLSYPLMKDNFPVLRMITPQKEHYVIAILIKPTYDSVSELFPAMMSMRFLLSFSYSQNCIQQHDTCGYSNIVSLPNS